MKLFRLFLIFILFLGINLCAEERVIVAKGEAAGSGLNAKERSLEDALRNALEQGFGVYIDSVTLVDNAALISDETIAETKGFIRSYDIIDERNESGIQYTKIRAVISMDKIWESDSLNLLLKRMGTPRFIIVSNESAEGQYLSENPALQKMTEILVNRGFQLVNAVNVEGLNSEQRDKIVTDLDCALKLGKKTDSEIIVLIKANAVFDKEAEVYGKKMIYFNGNTKAKVIQLDTGKIISSSSGKAIRGGTALKEAIFDTISFATLNASDDLIRGILSSWSKHLNMGRSIEIIVKNISVSQLFKIIEAIKSIEGVSEVSQRKYSSRIAQLEIKSKHKALYLAESIENLPGFGIEVKEFSSARIILYIK